MKKIIFALLVLLSFQAHAEYIKGKKLEDKIQMGSYNLVLNGAGIRAKFVVDVYVVALYLSKKVHDEETLFADKGPKRISLHMLRDVKSSLFSNGLNASILANQTEAEMVTLEKKVDELMHIISAYNELKEGGNINLDYWPGVGTKVMINGEHKGTIEGDDFYRALLRIWVGKRPVNHSLKDVLLGHEGGQ